MIRYAVTIGLGAFLLFAVQPILGRFILPWFGGGANVWTACMLFFQVGLLVGYTYAHWLGNWKKPQMAALVHMLLLGISLWFLPIEPSEAWKPTSEQAPVQSILLLLLVSVGAPYLLLASTGPLLQKWFSYNMPGRSPYRLYALSNAASLLALLTYPFIVEPTTRLGMQSILWVGAYMVFTVCCSWCAIKVMFDNRQLNPAHSDPDSAPDSEPDRTPSIYEATNAESTANTDSTETESSPSELVTTNSPEANADIVMPTDQNADAQNESDSTAVDSPPEPAAFSWITVAFWLGLSASGSAMLLATTNQMCQEVAVVPFLWVAPLSLYLLTFIICFDKDRWYDRRIWGVVLVIAVSLACIALYGGLSVPLWLQIIFYSLVLFACCMTCHGELVRSKPHTRYLTLFYLMISLGGALGGVFVAIVAPMIFTGYWEFHVALVATCALTLAAWWRSGVWKPHVRHWGPVMAPLLGMLLTLAGVLAWHVIDSQDNIVESKRNFYGVIRVKALETDWVEIDKDTLDTPKVQRFADELIEEDGKLWVDLGPAYRLVHGNIMHGFQYIDPDKLDWPTSYYSAESGVGVAIKFHPRRHHLDAEKRKLRIGVVGLGTGTIAAYGKKGDVIRFYEINPQVVEMASSYFSYIRDSEADVQLALGDARIQMERELRDNGSQNFDVLVIDAFSSDSIPIHLLTEEAAEIYFNHLKSDGLLMLHISNRYLDLMPVARGLGQIQGIEPIRLTSYDDELIGASGATWVLLTHNSAFMSIKKVSDMEERLTEKDREPLLWTDDFAGLWQILD